jgi:hypothetical protein
MHTICDSGSLTFGGSWHMKTFLVAFFAAIIAAVISVTADGGFVEGRQINRVNAL